MLTKNTHEQKPRRTDIAPHGIANIFNIDNLIDYVSSSSKLYKVNQIIEQNITLYIRENKKLAQLFCSLAIIILNLYNYKLLSEFFISAHQKVLAFYLGLKSEVCFGLWDAQDSPRTEVRGFLESWHNKLNMRTIIPLLTSKAEASLPLMQ